MVTADVAYWDIYRTITITEGISERRCLTLTTLSRFYHTANIAMNPQDFIKEKSNLWIFGYGSLVWKPDFAYKRRKVGHITGYKRRFWQGDDFYRGDKDKVNTYLVHCT